MKDKEKRREYYRRKHEEAKLAYAAFIPYYPLTLEDLPGEVWKDIAGFDGYQVSTFGRVKSFKWTKPRILKPHLRGEYLSVDLCFDGKTKHQPVHILVAQAFIPNLEGKPEVNHDDGHKFNCHVSNLYWATRANPRRLGNRSIQPTCTRPQIRLQSPDHFKYRSRLIQDFSQNFFFLCQCLGDVVEVFA